MGLPESYWIKALHLHLTWHPFAVRHFQNYPILLLHKVFNLSIKQSFFTIQFILYLLIGPFFYRYLRVLSFNNKSAYLGLVLLLISYPIVGAYFEPVFTWDDFWSYLFIILMLTSFIKKQWIISGVFFLLGLFAREQVVVFIPIMLLMMYKERKNYKINVALLSTIIPLIIYIIFRVIVWEKIDPKRWELLLFNFSDKRITDTVVSLIIAFGFMWVTSIFGLFEVYLKRRKGNNYFLFWGGITTVFLTLIIGLSFAFARETRILFPPFVFVIPLSLLAIKSVWERISRKSRKLFFMKLLIITPFLLIFGIIMATKIFVSFDYGANSYFRTYLAGFHFGLIALFLILKLAGRVKSFQTNI